MSGIAGFACFDGSSADPALIAAMLHALTPNIAGCRDWTGRDAALGIVQTRTLPIAREAVQPVRDERSALTLLFDGRLDNRDELRRGIGTIRGRELAAETADAELALRAYEQWGSDCAEHLVGEFVLVVWDAPRHRMFAATDATGTRSLFYTSASGMFAFASRPKALFRLPGVGKTLNETKLLDYLVSDHDRDDVTATIYRQVRALAPASALVAGPGTIRTWRYWKPEQLAPLPHGTIDDYIEPFLGVLGNAIDCRLQTAERVASFLSGGLDSSTLVAMQRQRLHKPADAVHTISLVGPDPAQCADTRAIEAMAAGGGIHSLRIPAASGRSHAEAFVSLSPELDDPFALLAGYPMWVAMRHARQEGYRVLIEGMCGDLLFFSPERTRQLVIEQRMLHRIPSLVRAHMRHGLEVPPRELVRRLVGAAAPRPLRRLYRSLRPWTEPRPHAEESGNHFFRFHPHVARVFEDSKRAAAASHPPRRTPLEAHAHVFTGGLMSFAHSLEGGLARLEGLEERSPYSDRRLIEFAVRMPPELKIAAPWYKYFLRRAAQDMLPPEVVWRQDLGSHPGIHFFEGLLAELENKQTMLVDPRTISRTLGTWLQPQAIEHLCQLRKHSPRQVVAYNLVSLALLTRWLDTHF